MADWRRDIFLVWRMIQPSSMRAAHDLWELIMMSWSPEPFREDRMRKFSIGVLNAAENWRRGSPYLELIYFKRGWRDESSADLQAAKKQLGWGDRDDIQTWVDLHDAEEGRLTR